jgi:hypothetical protein
MTSNRRWLKSAIAASEAQGPALPWQRGQRRKPEALKPATQKSTIRQAIAAR